VTWDFNHGQVTGSVIFNANNKTGGTLDYLNTSNGMWLHGVVAPGRGGPVLREVEDAQMVAGRVLGGDVRRIDGERVEVVRVGGGPEGAVALEDPVTGDRHLGPVPGVESRLGERVVRTVGGRRQPETPPAVQGQRTGVRGRVPGAGRKGPAAG
jgi:hypothetical protein